tara:strand:+ start:2501 stop:3610 length:1110 start_codon:yes stop_codon:yes gene_type:complete
MDKKLKASDNMFSAPFNNYDDVYVIAEIGKNFIQSEDERSLDEYVSNSKKLIDAAKMSGADAVKFQTHVVEDEQLNLHIKSPHFEASDRYSWVLRNTNATPISFWKQIYNHCQKSNITFFTTPMSRNAVRKVNDFVRFWKIGSGDVQDYILLNEILKTKKPVILSTGMVSFSELEEVVSYITDNGTDLVILYCVSQYPCPKEAFNLSTIEALRDKYPNITIGFSDHSIGSEVALAAVKIGARVIEKHFSLDRDFWGSDHKVSMVPKEMKAMVDSIKSKDFERIDSSKFYGHVDRELEGANNIYRPYFEKKLVAAENLPSGVILTEEIMYAMRPSKEIVGIPSNKIRSIIGKKTTVPINKYQPITMDGIK